jgi:hypothetical protein
MAFTDHLEPDRDPNQRRQRHVGGDHGEGHHGLQPDRVAQQDMGGGDLPKRPPDFSRAVQHKPTTHAGRGAGIDLVEKRGTKEVCAVDGCCEELGAGIKRGVVVVVGVVQAHLRPGADTDMVVEARPGLEARHPGLIDDAGGVADAEPVEERTAVGRGRFQRGGTPASENGRRDARWRSDHRSTTAMCLRGWLHEYTQS